MDFLGMSVWIWDFLIMELLPTLVVIISLVYVVKIMQAIPETADRWMEEQNPK